MPPGVQARSPKRIRSCRRTIGSSRQRQARPSSRAGPDDIVAPDWQGSQHWATGRHTVLLRAAGCAVAARKSHEGNRQLLQPAALAAKTVSTDRIKSLRMVHISGRDTDSRQGRRKGQDKQPYPTPGDVQTQRVVFFHTARPARCASSDYADSSSGALAVDDRQIPARRAVRRLRLTNNSLKMPLAGAGKSTVTLPANTSSSRSPSITDASPLDQPCAGHNRYVRQAEIGQNKRMERRRTCATALTRASRGDYFGRRRLVGRRGLSARGLLSPCPSFLSRSL